MALADLQQQLKALLAQSPTFREMMPQYRQQMIGALMNSSEDEMTATINILRDEAAAPQPDFAGMMEGLEQAEKDLRKAFLEDKERLTRSKENPEALLDRIEDTPS